MKSAIILALCLAALSLCRYLPPRRWCLMYWPAGSSTPHNGEGVSAW